MPDWVDPMLATLTDQRFSSSDWIYERKLDGERCLAFIRDGRVSLRSRNQQALDETYPELKDALSAQPTREAIVDGEVVAFDGACTSFSRLQGRIGLNDADAARAARIPVFLYLFDIVYLDGFDISKLKLRSRKQLLRSQFRFRRPIRLVPHRNEKGVDYYEQACDRGWEGVIAKRATSPYRHCRSRDWLKFKCGNAQEFVVCGYTEPQGQRRQFGALLLAYYEDGSLRYAGKVGTGFDEAMLEQLGPRLRSLRRKTSPCEPIPAAPAGTQWVTPRIVAEVAFTEWTRAGRLRHPRFVGLREDKAAASVVRETPDR